MQRLMTTSTHPAIRRWSKAMVLPFSCLYLISMSGCGGSATAGKFKPVNRAVASGSVTFDGQSVSSGTVSFTHKESGLPSLCVITNGKYSSETGKGPQIGLNTASLASKEADGKLIWATTAPIEVAVDDAKFSKDFAITGSQVKKANAPAASATTKSGEKKWPGDED